MHMCYILGACNLSNLAHIAYEEANVLTPTEGMAIKMHVNISFEIKLFCKLESKTLICFNKTHLELINNKIEGDFRIKIP